MEVGGFSAFVVGLALLPFIGSWVESTLWTCACATCAACAIRASLCLNKLNIYIYIYIYIISYTDTSSTAQGGGGSFKNRKPIGEVGCCESRMAERIH